jgi:hypothetical protein
MKANFVLVLVFVLFLTGCTKLGLTRSDPVWPWTPKVESKLSGCLNGNCSQKDAYEAVLATVTYCRQVSNHYENGGNVTDRTRLGVKVLGVLAGSVFGVTAGGSAAKAWSGLSGATNGIQSDLGENSLLRANRAKLISGILEDYDKALQKPFSKGSMSAAESSDVVRASLSTSARCAVASEAIPEDINRKVEEQVDKIKSLATELSAGGSASAGAAVSQEPQGKQLPVVPEQAKPSTQ